MDFNDLPLENWTADSWKILIYRPGRAEIGDEEVTVQRYPSAGGRLFGIG